MSLADTLTTALAREGAKLIDGKGSESFDELLAEGWEKVPDLAAAVNKELPGGGKLTEEAAADILSKLQAGKPRLLRLTKWGFAQIVGYLEGGDEAAARRVYIETEATFGETIAFQYASGDHALLEQKEREESWEAVKELLLSIGTIGLKLVVKLVLGGLGIPALG